MDAQSPQDGKIIQQETLAGPIPKTKLVFPARAEALHPLQERFVFWTPSIAYLWGGFHDHVFLDFMAAYNQEIQLYHHRFPVPFFRGLDTFSGNKDWNYVLWATEIAHWDSLVDYLCSITLMNTPGKTVFKYATQVVEIADPIYLQRNAFSTMAPLVPVHMLCVKTNHWTAAMELEGTHPLLAPPYLRFYGADERCKMYAQSLFSSSDPTLAMQKEQDRGNQDGLPSGDSGGGDT